MTTVVFACNKNLHSYLDSSQTFGKFYKILNISGNITLRELSLRCKEDERVVRVLDRNKQIFPAGVFHLMKAPVRFSSTTYYYYYTYLYFLSRFTSIKNINVVDCQEVRRIEFPDDFDGRIKTDVRLFLMIDSH